MLERLVPLFTEGERFYGRYRLAAQEEPPVEVVGGALWEVPVFPSGSQSCELMRVYAFDSTVGQLLEAHWRNEARALLRLSTRAHRALPRLREAELLGHRDIGYIIVSDTGYPLSTDDALLAELGSDRRRAFLAFYAIVEAVAAMHEEGLLHRNLSLHALRVVDDAGTIVVDGFQMSSFITTWFRSKRQVHHAGLAPPDPLGRWMLAPERLAALQGEPLRDVETYATDVFGLGMIGLRLFGEAFSEPPAKYTAAAHREWIEQQRAGVRRARLPVALGRALEAMTAVDRRNRVPSAVAVHEVLSKAYGSILWDLEWRADRGEQAYELLYLSESVRRMYDDGRSQSHPSEPDYEEYNELIAHDLMGGILTWSPDGFERWERTGDRRIARLARVVLLGRAYAYFCAYLDAGRPGEDRERLVVKHMLPKDRASVLRRTPQQRAAPRLKCGHFAPGTRRPQRIPGTVGWSELIETVQHEGGRAAQEPLVGAARWLIDAERADIRRKWYQVERLHEEGDLLRLREVENPEPAGNDPASAFDRLWALATERAPMGEAFAAHARRALEAGQLPAFVLRAHREDRDGVAELRFDSSVALDRHTSQFRITKALGPIPDSAWVMPDDRGERRNLGRQFDAVLDVEQRYGHLAAQLRAPRAVRIPADGLAKPSGPQDEVQALVQRMHETWPLFALQGPPGTGKTYVAAELLKRILGEDPFARILVSAQSHHALDNLLDGVLVRLADVAALRIASEQTRDKVDPIALAYTLQARVDAVVTGIAGSTPSGDAKLRSITTEWRNRARKKEVELRADVARRLPRASSLVFTTSMQATHEVLGSSRGAGSFDWVIIEEAARGWVTEFLVPMVHGARWCLVGDHAQLAAHRQEEFENLLQRDIDEHVTADAVGISPTPEWRQYLRYFAHLMKPQGDGRREEPRARLDTQRRMHPDIAGLIERAFYPDGLSTHATARRDHGIGVAPFAGTALVWLDTSSLGPDGYEFDDGGLCNLCEVMALSHIVRNRIGMPARFDTRTPPLAVLSPYKTQVKLLRERLNYPDETVHTVDSFQGREAEVVLVSLARNNAAEHTDKAIGFLREPSRVNVMFSRARRLLVIVGSTAHFERHASGTFWQTVLGYVRSDRRFLVDVGGEGFRWTRRVRQ